MWARARASKILFNYWFPIGADRVFLTGLRAKTVPLKKEN
jgi:hypothetical protein